VGDAIVKTGPQCRTVGLLAVGAGVANDFDLDGVLGDFDTGTFSLVCYGPTIQDDPQDAQFDIAAIWANQVVDNWILDADKFSPLYDDYESAVGGSSPSYVISDFTPHPDSCDCPE